MPFYTSRDISNMFAITEVHCNCIDGDDKNWDIKKKAINEKSENTDFVKKDIELDRCCH